MVYAWSILDNRLRYLPEITGRAIASVDWSLKLIDIGKKFGLAIDELEDLQSVVLRSMIGMIAPAEFENSLIAALAISPATAEKLITEINVQVFEPIHQFVISGGKSDGMAASGIILQGNSDSEPTPLAINHTEAPAALEFGQTNFGGTVPPPPKPIVTDDDETPQNFNDFFITTPTETDQSMGK